MAKEVFTTDETARQRGHDRPHRPWQDHADRRHSGRPAAKGLAKFKSYADIAKGGTVRDATKTVTIAVAHVEYETESGTTPTSTARATPTSSRT